MQSTTAGSTKQAPDGDAISERPAAVARDRPPARIGAGVSSNSKGTPNEDGTAQAGASDKSGIPNDGTDPAAAALEKEMGRFVDRGEGSKPVAGRQILNPLPDPPRGSAYRTAPQPLGTGKSRPLPQTATGKSTKPPQKK